MVEPREPRAGETRAGKGRVGAAAGTQTCSPLGDPGTVQSSPQVACCEERPAGGEEAVPVGEAKRRFHQ